MSDDSSRILTVSKEGTVMIWDLDPMRLQDTIRRSASLCLDSEFRQRVMGESSEQATRREKACNACVTVPPTGDAASYRRCVFAKGW
jgi:hypothetical protein